MEGRVFTPAEGQLREVVAPKMQLRAAFLGFCLMSLVGCAAVAGCNSYGEKYVYNVYAERLDERHVRVIALGACGSGMANCWGPCHCRTSCATAKWWAVPPPDAGQSDDFPSGCGVPSLSHDCTLLDSVTDGCAAAPGDGQTIPLEFVGTVPKEPPSKIVISWGDALVDLSSP